MATIRARKRADGTTQSTAIVLLGHDGVSLTPAFTESITRLDHETAELYFQCIYFDVNNNDALGSNATFGLPTETLHAERRRFSSSHSQRVNFC